MPRLSSATKTKRTAIASVFIAVAMVVPLSPAGGQSPSPGPEIELRFAGGPLWRTPDQPLNLRVEIRNSSPAPLEGFRMIVGVSDRVLTRSALEASFIAQPGISASALPFVFDDVVPAEDSTRIRLTEPVSSFVTLASATEGGVFPATIALQDPTTLQVLATLQVPLIYYPEPPETRLKIATLLPLNERPNRSPDGTFIDDGDDLPPLARGALEGGWLEAFITSLEEMTASPPPSEGSNRKKNKKDKQPPAPDPLRLSMTIGPRMLEELVDISDGFTLSSGDVVDESADVARAAARTIDRLSALTSRAPVQSVVMPYAFPDIPTLVERLPTEALLEQFSAARLLLREHLGSAAGRGWLFPPAGRLDQPSLERLQLIQDVAANAFVSSDSLRSDEDPAGLVGCPELSQSFTCPIAMSTGTGTTVGLTGDPGLSARLAGLQLGSNDRLSLQRFFAETSMIREEAPGVPDRVVQATIPSLWQPAPSLGRLLLKGLRDAPWLQSVRADEAIQVGEVVERPLIERAPSLAAEPDPSFFEAVAEADGLIDSFSSFAPDNNRRLARMRTNLLMSQSRMIWRDPSLTGAYVIDSRSEAQSEMGKVSIEGTDDFTCTSRDCRLQLLLTNAASYPARVSLEMLSPGLKLEPAEIDEVYEPGDHPLTIKAATNSSGISRLAARLETVDGGYLIQEKEIVIRSTNFNRIALVITVGALAFLILFYVFRSAKRRGAKGEATS